MQRAYGNMPLVGNQAAAFTGAVAGLRVDNGTYTRAVTSALYWRKRPLVPPSKRAMH